MTPEEFRAAGHQIIDWIADYRANVAARPVMAKTEPGDIKRQLPGRPPDQPEPLVAGQVTAYTIDLHSNNHAFLAGHRVMVGVQSTWFPLIDRNPQKFVPNIFMAAEADFQKAEQRVYRSRTYPSNVELPVVR